VALSHDKKTRATVVQRYHCLHIFLATGMFIISDKYVWRLSCVQLPTGLSLELQQ
jgi:hypothetical protein